MYPAVRKHFLVLVLALYSTFLAAQSSEKWECCLHGAGIAVDSFCKVVDEKFDTPDYSSIDQTFTVKNVVSLSIRENELVVLPPSFSLEVTVFVKWTDESSVVHNEFKTLHVCYDSSSLHHDTLISFYEFNGGHIVVDSIVAINATNLTNPLPDIFSLCNTIMIERSYSFACYYSAVLDEVSYLVDDDELLVSWQTPSDGIKEETEFDLEWTFYDDSSQLAINYVATGIGLNVNNSFYNNASRVVVNDYHYQIPLLYENGYIVYRIRPVKVLASGQRIAGQWTSDIYPDDPDYIYHNTGHEEKINWQASTTFAEEGKRKSVVSYFDGASKSRQTTTKINSDSIAVVAETMYDFEGRPVIATLPAPVIDSRKIEHYDFFNVNTNVALTTYNWQDLDSAAGCLPTPRVMNNASAASMYYSSQNPLRTTSYHQFIPDARGYPFSQTQYTSDLTNRIQASSGPGNEHHLRETNPHVTRYYYGGAEQSELRYMFGQEAGNRTHYFKNLVIDPNNQVAVTYTDMHGRTIATALAGDTVESGMNRLSNYRDAVILRDTIIDPSNQLVSNLSITGNKTFVVSTAGIHKFYYNLAPKQMIITACDSSDFCFDCVYDLKIRVTDNCGNHNLPGDTAYVFIKNNYNPGNDSVYYFDTLCKNEPLPIVDSFELYLLVGTYTVSKSLTIKEEAIDYYFDYYYRNDTCIKRFEDFYGDALSNIDVSGCNMTCAACLAQLGDSATFIDSFLHKILVQDSTIVLNANDTAGAVTAYLHLKDACDILCDSFNVCDFKRGLMISDVTPGSGQYAVYVVDNLTGIYSTSDKASVFNSTSTFYPHAPIYKWSGLVYRDDRGVPDTLHIFDEATQDTIELLPNDLSLEMFIKYWKPSWANTLLNYHPEICNYNFCVSNSASHDYDQAMMKIDNYDTAVLYGFFNPLNHTFAESGFLPNTSNMDPFFSSTYGAAYHDSMYSRMNVFQRIDSFGNTINFSIWDLAARSIGCGVDYTSCFQCKKERYWIAYRSFYLGMKKAYVDSAMVRNYIDNCSTSGTYLDFNSDSLSGKTPRFELIWTALPPLPPGLPDTTALMQQVRDSISNNSNAFSCEDYAPYWWGQIKTCGFDSAKVINEFVQVCKLGTDNSHPYGASSTPGPTYFTSNGNRSFEDVLRWADSLSNIYMTPDSNNYPSADCSHFLINNPQPYSVTTFYYQHIALDKPDTCVCGNIKKAVSLYQLSGDTSRTLSQYLEQENQITVTEEDIQLLYQACNDSICTNLKHPVAVPYQFDCDRVCVSCYQLISTFENFLSEFPDVHKSANYQTLMQSYMNEHLAMNLTSIEYMEFMYDSCGYTYFPSDSTDNCLPPIATNDSCSLPIHCSQYIPVLLNDFSSDGSHVSIVKSGGGNGVVSVDNNRVVYRALSYQGYPDIIVYQLCNDCGLCDTATISINTTNDTCNTPPVGIEDELAMCDSETVYVSLLLNDYDADGDPMYVKEVQSSSLVSVALNGSQLEIISLTPGTDKFSYIVCDSFWNTCDTATVYITVQDCGTDTLIVLESRRMPTRTRGKLVMAMLDKLGYYVQNPNISSRKFTSHSTNQDFIPFAYLSNVYAKDAVTINGTAQNALKRIWDNVYHTPNRNSIYSLFSNTFIDTSAGYLPKSNFTFDYVHGGLSANNSHINLDQVDFEQKQQHYRDLLGAGTLARRNTASIGNFLMKSKSLSKSMNDLLVSGLLRRNSTLDKPDGEVLPSGRGRNVTGSVFNPYFSISAQANWCDSIGAAVADWESTYPTLGSRNKSNFLDVMYYDLGVLSPWIDGIYHQIDTCGIACPEMIDCAAAAAVTADFKAEYPALSDSCFDWVFAFYMNTHAGSGSYSKTFDVADWRVLLECCGTDYPTPDTLATYCDTINAITNYYHSTESYGKMDLQSLYLKLVNFTGGSCNIYTLAGLMGDCNISASTLFPCTWVDSMMNEYNTSFPMYADSAPTYLWSTYYLNFSLHGGPNIAEWIVMLDSCGIPHPVENLSMTYCDSVKTMVDWYNEMLPNQYYFDLIVSLNSLFGRPNFWFDSIVSDMAYWRTQFDSCGTGLPKFVNCTSVDSIMDDFRESYPFYSDSCPTSIWVDYLNSHNAAGGLGWPTKNEWIALLNFCDIPYPLIDTTATICDSVALGIMNYNTNFTEHNLWKFMNAMAVYLGYGYNDSTSTWVPYTYNYYLDLVDACGFPCPDIVKCNYVDSLMGDFYTLHPSLVDSCPPSVWAQYLNEHGAGGPQPGGYIWYTDPAVWMRLLQCCNIEYPKPDTLSTKCDSVSFVVANYAELYPEFGLPGIIEGFKDLFDGYYTGPGNAPISLWTNLMDSCGYNCGEYTPCATLDSVLGDFYDEYPQYVDTCPDWVIETYMNSHIIKSLDHGLNYSDWNTLFKCCSKVLPESDKYPDRCDTLVVVQYYHQFIDSMFRTMLGIPCTPSWAYNLYLNQAFHINVQVSEMCDSSSLCMVACPDTCVLSSFCDSLVSVYTIMTDLLPIVSGGGSSGAPSIVDIVNLVMGTSYSEAEMYIALASCDTSFCGPVNGLMSYVGPLFESYDSCMPVASFTGAMAGVTGVRMDYSGWCNLLSNCGYSCPDTCNNSYSKCDSFWQAYQLYQHIRATLGGSDTTSLIQGVFSAYYGYTILYTQYLKLKGQCDTSVICPPRVAVYNNLQTLFEQYDSCAPAWVVLAVYSANIPRPGGGQYNYAELCSVLAMCNLPCPDTCEPLGNTSCDSILSVYELYRNTVAAYGVSSPGMDTLAILGYIQNSLLHTTYPYNTFMLMVASCRCPEQAHTFAVADSLLDLVGSCAPEWYIQLVYASTLGYSPMPTYSSICAMAQECGLSCPDTCPVPLTHCDTILEIKRVLDSLKVGITNPIALNGYTSYITTFVLGYSVPTYSQLSAMADSCMIPPCEATDTIQYYIRQYLSTHHGVLYQPQLVFNSGLYTYLNNVFNVHDHYVDWCARLVACNDTCPKVIPSPYLCDRPLLPPIDGEAEDSCMAIEEDYAYITAAAAYKDYLHNLYTDFVNQYVEKCLGAYQYEQFDYEHPMGEYHFTLYYYDQAGNLVKTIPPAGFDTLGNANHIMATVYRYNTLNQPVEEHTPDAGNTYRWYDLIGKPVFSQNAQQNIDSQCSYTLYDRLQRITEVGRFNYIDMSLYSYRDSFALLGQSFWYPLITGSGTNPPYEVTRTYYDEDLLAMSNRFGALGQQNLRNRVASATYEDVDDYIDTTYNAASHYSYDVHGNVKVLLQQNNAVYAKAHRFKRLDYQYDLISGKVNNVVYQRGQPDQFIHRYEYDADNRITDVYTSRDSTVFTHDAHYQYYLHGSLARIVLGEHQVQGVDYAYTIQGWLKLINSGTHSTARDMGHDGVGAYTARDAYGYSLGYFNNDYRAINNTLTATNYPELSTNTLGQHSLYNGNIAHTVYFNNALSDTPTARTYRYDQLNRLISANTFILGNPFTGLWLNRTWYNEQLTYDANGNILTNYRNGEEGNTSMDDMEYHYVGGTNKLDYVTDAVSSSNYATDIDNQSTGNYQYDAIGNLTKDVAEGIDNIQWTVYGKIHQINKANGDTLRFAYDATGNRISKEYYKDSTGIRTFIYYQRDATGNIMATYQQRDTTLTLTELPMYGSSRLGTVSPGLLVYPAAVPDSSDPTLTGIGYFAANFKQYELTNHLGNVLSTISDRKLPKYLSGTFSHYEPEIVTAQDYYSFGSIMPGRSFSTPGYSYGFNGQEKDDEVKGSGNSMTAEFWEYDSRLARRWNGDQIYKPWEAPYSCFNDNPIYYADPVGLDGEGPNGECPGDVDSKGQVYGGTLNEVTVTALKSNTISAYHLSNSIDAKRAQNVEKYKQDIQRTYANLDWEHGQVEPPISNFANTLFYSNRRVWMPDEHGNGWGINAQGYLTGKYVRQPIGGAGALEYLGGEGELKTLTSMSEGRALLKEGEYFLYMAEKKGLPYIGSTEKLLGRYTQGEIEELNARMFKFFVDNPAIRMPNRGIAIGFEQMVIKLNNAGEVINSTNKGVLLANLKNAASKEIYLIEAEKWAAKNIPNWQTLFKIKQ